MSAHVGTSSPATKVAKAVGMVDKVNMLSKERTLVIIKKTMAASLAEATRQITVFRINFSQSANSQHTHGKQSSLSR